MRAAIETPFKAPLCGRWREKKREGKRKKEREREREREREGLAQVDEKKGEEREQSGRGHREKGSAAKGCKTSEKEH